MSIYQTCNRSVLIPTLVQQAILLKRRDVSASHDKAIEALSLAEPGGGVRFFLDYGTSMEDILAGVGEQTSSKGFLEQILEAFQCSRQKNPGVSPHQAVLLSASAQPKPQPLVDPLTERELEILQQLLKGKANKVIGEELFISTDTVKTHLRNIYHKLGVNSRLQAVTKANDLGFNDENY